MGHQCHQCCNERQNQCGCQNRKKKKDREKLACIICLFITMLLIILLLVLYFSVFKPKDPRVQVPVMQMVSYSAVGSPPAMSSVSLGLALQVLIYNPNRGDFYIDGGSTASIYYEDAQLGLTFLPNITHISSRSFMTFGVNVGMEKPISLNMSTFYTQENIMIPLPISTVVTIFGHVTTAGVFSHHSSIVSICNLNVALGSPRTYIQSYVCKKSYPLND